GLAEPADRPRPRVVADLDVVPGQLAVPRIAARSGAARHRDPPAAEGRHHHALVLLPRATGAGHGQGEPGDCGWRRRRRDPGPALTREQRAGTDRKSV